MTEFVTLLLVGYGVCAAIFVVVWAVVGWLTHHKE